MYYVYVIILLRIAILLLFYCIKDGLHKLIKIINKLQMLFELVFNQNVRYKYIIYLENKVSATEVNK